MRTEIIIQIKYEDSHGCNSASIWVDEVGLVFNNENNNDDDFDTAEAERNFVGDGLGFVTLWDSGEEGKELLKDFFDEDITEIKEIFNYEYNENCGIESYVQVEINNKFFTIDRDQTLCLIK